MHRSDGEARPRGFTSETAREANLQRMKSEDWTAMTEAARASRRHTGSLDRWADLARQANPGLTDAQIERLAVMMRREHFARLSKLGVQAREARRAGKPAT